MTGQHKGDVSRQTGHIHPSLPHSGTSMLMAVYGLLGNLLAIQVSMVIKRGSGKSLILVKKDRCNGRRTIIRYMITAKTLKDFLKVSLENALSITFSKSDIQFSKFA